MILAALMMVMGAMPVLADVDVDRVSDREPVRPTNLPADVEVDRPVEPEVARPTDGPSDTRIDRPVDREIDRYRCVDFVNDRRCIDDRHPHENLRHLIQRLINAGEWEKLFRLLHRLGIV